MALYDPIMDALLALLQTECGDLFKTYSRRFMTWEQLAASIQKDVAPPQPALYLYDGPGLGGGITHYVQSGRTPAKRSVIRTVVIYAKLPGGGTPGGFDQDTPGGSVFYPLIEAVEAAMDSRDNNSFGTLTLGGLVSHCWIEGDGVLVTGEIDADGQGMATLPINILIP